MWKLFKYKMIISAIAKSKKKLFLKDPETTDLGKRIIENSIKLIDELGFDSFNFKKLASAIDSTEASIYRYFENKNKLLFYLISWYWSWVKYNIDYKTHNLKNPVEKLRIVVKVLVNSLQDDPETQYVDEEVLARIVITESSKAYMTKHVEEDFQDGLFEAYKELSNKVSEIIISINPSYKTPKALALNLIRGTHTQMYFMQHLPDLTDIELLNDENQQGIEIFLEDLLFSILKTKSK